MRYITANEAKTKFGEVLDSCAREPVVVKRHGRPKAVVISYEDYELHQQQKLDALRAEIAKADRDLADGNYKSYDQEGLKALFQDAIARGKSRHTLAD